jgi:predicted nucleotidyltransferase
MDRTTALARLRARESELRAMGVESLSLFGSVARGEAGPDSDIDLAARFDPAKRITLFGYAGITERIREMIGAPVDLVSEPARKARLQALIDRDRVHVF